MPHIFVNIQNATVRERITIISGLHKCIVEVFYERGSRKVEKQLEIIDVMYVFLKVHLFISTVN